MAWPMQGCWRGRRDDLRPVAAVELPGVVAEDEGLANELPAAEHDGALAPFVVHHRVDDRVGWCVRRRDLVPVRAVELPGVVQRRVVDADAAEHHHSPTVGVVGHAVPRPGLRRGRRVHLLPARAVVFPGLADEVPLRREPLAAEQHRSATAGVVREVHAHPVTRRRVHGELGPSRASQRPGVGQRPRRGPDRRGRRSGRGPGRMPWHGCGARSVHSLARAGSRQSRRIPRGR